MMMLRSGHLHRQCWLHSPPSRLCRQPVIAARASGSSANTKKGNVKPAARRAPVRKGTAAAKQADRQRIYTPTRAPQQQSHKQAVPVKPGNTVWGKVQQISAAGARVEIEGAAGLQAFVALQECATVPLRAPIEALRSGMVREFKVKAVQQQCVTLSIAALQADVLLQRMKVLEETHMVVPVTVLGLVGGKDSDGDAGLRVEYKMNGCHSVFGFIPEYMIERSVTGGDMQALVGQELPAAVHSVSQGGVKVDHIWALQQQRRQEQLELSNPEGVFNWPRQSDMRLPFLRPGSTVQGTVQRVSAAGARVEIEEAAGLQAFVALQECATVQLQSPLEALRSGMVREFKVKSVQQQRVTLSIAALEADAVLQRLRLLVQDNIVVPVMVLQAMHSKASGKFAGLRVEYKMSGCQSVPGFMPASEMRGTQLLHSLLGLQDVAPGGDDMSTLVGHELPAVVQLLSEGDVTFSHRAALAALKQQAVEKVKVGGLVDVVVTSVKTYGAFVSLGDHATGMLHISQISHARLTTVEQVLKVGDKFTAMVLSTDQARGRVAVSTKKLEKEPGDFLAVTNCASVDEREAFFTLWGADMRAMFPW